MDISLEVLPTAGTHVSSLTPWSLSCRERNGGNFSLRLHHDVLDHLLEVSKQAIDRICPEEMRLVNACPH
jgi:hypothetical protein